ncbi:MAG: heparan-alpha-glucosaminide N-acetyltransferase domain-containing protein [Capnocytophaga felis]|nr:heparan-alpha-glucosaminide N-acetyltransferase domain-containing protein [Capnocytophaga felis]
MKNPIFRLYFIDVMRAFAICMMLQGHFVDGLLANEYRTSEYPIYSIWLFLRGLTAPVFFTVSGFIFMYLLAKEKTAGKTGWNHVRVIKGIRRGVVLIVTAYLLRIHFWSLFSGKIYPNSYMIDVLHCIGLSLLFMIAIYLFSYQRKTYVMPSILMGFTLLSFAFAPIYLAQNYDFLPIVLANYFTQANGSVFTIFPWFGYASFGAFIGVLFSMFKDKKHIYDYAIILAIVFGALLSFGSQPFFSQVYNLTDWQLAFLISKSSLFSRLGNVLLIFAIFMLLRNVIMSATIRTIGQNTLSIYIIHYIILYGSFTGFGLYQYFHHSLNPYVIVFGALSFILVNIWLSFKYNQWKPFVVDKYEIIKNDIKEFLTEGYYLTISFFNKLKSKILNFIFVSKRNS